MRLQEDRAARSWNLTPSQWDELDKIDKARCIALSEAESMMALIDAERQYTESQRRGS